MIEAARLEIYRHLLAAVTERMGDVLERCAWSANIKERRDFSCALFDAAGRLISQAAHIPVHLGSMPDALAAARGAFTFRAGDVVLLNDPYAGGTHLPDITMISPVFLGDELVAFACNRAHHADVGGAAPGSMTISRSIYEEGVRIPPVKWHDAGKENEAATALLLANVRTPVERRGDLAAQLAANRIGADESLALINAIGRPAFDEGNDRLIEYAGAMMRAVIEPIPDGEYTAEACMDDDGASTGPLWIRLTLRIRGGEAEADFSRTDPQSGGCVNCPVAVARAATYYCFACLASEDLPRCAGMFAPIRVVARPGTLVSAVAPAAVAGGNVETSQRIVDCVLAALAQALPGRIPAESAGTMNSLSLGGVDPRTSEPFAYYETIGGGVGAGPWGDGASAIQTHMTNTRNTPAEALEATYPLRVRAYAVRTGSGGAGAHRGGDGIVREIESLADGVRGSLLADRHAHAPQGRAGGAAGGPGAAEIIRADGRVERVSSKACFELGRGDRVRIYTPGGGGFGPAADSARA